MDSPDAMEIHFPERARPGHSNLLKQKQFTH